MLAALGLGPAEEEIYRLLVARGRATVHELAADGGRPESEVREILTAMAGRGLVVPQAIEGAATLFAAAPPAVALGGELRRRRDELSAAEHAVLALAEQHRTGAEGGAVEVISEIDAVRHRFRQLQESARYEVRSMMVPELSVVPSSANAAERAGVRRGVQYRTIVHREALTEPGMVAQALADLAAGQRIGVADAVPVKLIIADRELAMLPLYRGRNTAAASVLVHAGGLLEALVAYFELAWEQAYPLSPHTTGDGLAEQRPDAIDEFDARMLALVLAGLTDQAVGARLGVSRRTVQRRIGELMARAGAESRIQLGWHAARKGWA
ncbi:helix-turn-helix domain-containing protein [Streptomyces rhizosphaerihabitans]|uniref:helix-turn-helix domain-containing protein n=1 Tax=Streptomyces rhizosphaerihabitans TaxID=1266770 RepID=UPI0021C12503|nr:helix-turn-helix domain-containing protein [Streptomyces rhizosphaerihabitans]MCT9007476.1 helix-turn-helix domain-containing protein [Streptomyces rhizosphaerihabitans]